MAGQLLSFSCKNICCLTKEDITNRLFFERTDLEETVPFCQVQNGMRVHGK